MHKNPVAGLIDLSNGAYAWLAPQGTWGWSNAGLVVDGQESILIDTLFDLDLTQTMLKAMRDAQPCTANIKTLVNTHANGDHCHGNELVTGADIIASSASAAEMDELPPEGLAAIMDAAKTMGPVGEYFIHCFGAFNFHGINYTPPTKTFDGELHMSVGDKPIHMLEVGPAHTRGDILVHSPADKTVFTGDILFIEGTPLIWEGPVANWINACRRIENMDVDHIVPGHGPITDKSGVRKVRQYLEYVREQAKLRYDAGMDAWEAAQDIALSEYSAWSEPERIAVNVDSLYREFTNDDTRTDVVELFRRMGELAGFKPQAGNQT